MLKAIVSSCWWNGLTYCYGHWQGDEIIGQIFFMLGEDQVLEWNVSLKLS